jgi:hypothetical protein
MTYASWQDNNIFFNFKHFLTDFIILKSDFFEHSKRVLLPTILLLTFSY